MREGGKVSQRPRQANEGTLLL